MDVKVFWDVNWQTATAILEEGTATISRAQQPKNGQTPNTR